ERLIGTAAVVDPGRRALQRHIGFLEQLSTGTDGEDALAMAEAVTHELQRAPISLQRGAGILAIGYHQRIEEWRWLVFQRAVGLDDTAVSGGERTDPRSHQTHHRAFGLQGTG